MSTEYCLVLCTCPDAATAQRLAEALVAERLAACVNILPGLNSVYFWEGRVESAPELLLLIKTETSRFAAIRDLLQEHHPYELPELIAVPVLEGSPAYLGWITASLQRPRDDGDNTLK